jgi:folate-dependent phosphoribosylglycinamide formyltransferase PurN
MLKPRPLRVAVLCSRRAPGLFEFLEDPRCGRDYEVVALVSSDPDSGTARRAERAGVHVIGHDIHAFCAERGRNSRDLEVRRAYDRKTLELLSPYDPDLILLSGYLYVLTRPILEAFEGRIVNVHDADLLRLASDGKPLYRGLHATRDAILAGEPETRLTAHIVTEEVDVGPALVRSWPFPVHPLVEDARSWGAEGILRSYAYAHREWMMGAAWGALLARTAELFAHGWIRTLDGRAIVGDSLGPEELRPEELRPVELRSDGVANAARDVRRQAGP